MGIYSVKTGAISYAAAVTKSCWLINPASEAFKIIQFGLTFDSAVAQTGFAVELYRTVTLGSPAGTTYTPVKVNGQADLSAASTTSLIVLGTEPTSSEVLAEWLIQPFGGFIDYQFPEGKEPMAAAAGQRLGLRVAVPAGATTCNARSYAWFKEI